MFEVWKYENEHFISMWNSFLCQLSHSVYGFYFSLSHWPQLLLSQGVLTFHIAYSVVLNVICVSWTVSGNKVFIVWELFGLVLKSRGSYFGLFVKGGDSLVFVVMDWVPGSSIYLWGNRRQSGVFFWQFICVGLSFSSPEDHGTTFSFPRNWVRWCIVLGNPDTVGHLSCWQYSFISDCHHDSPKPSMSLRFDLILFIRVTEIKARPCFM